MTDPLGQLGKVSRQYQEMASSFDDVATAAARAEAAYKVARAKRILRAMAADPKCSHARAETIAEGDDQVAGLYQERVITAAKVEAHRAKLHQLREQVSNGRTFAATQREVDKIHAEGWGGGA